MLALVLDVRSLLVDFVVGLQDIALYESGGGNGSSNHTNTNNEGRQAQRGPHSNSMVSGSSSDEIGSLVELVTAEQDLQSSLLKLGHLIRVWLALPKQAIFFYQQALNVGLMKLN